MIHHARSDLIARRWPIFTHGAQQFLHARARARAFINIQRIIRAIGNAIRAEIIPLSVVRWLPDRFRGEEVPDSIVIQIDRTDYRSLLRALIDCLQNFMQPLRIQGGFTVRRHANNPGADASRRFARKYATRARGFVSLSEREREEEECKILCAAKFLLEFSVELARARVHVRVCVYIT